MKQEFVTKSVRLPLNLVGQAERFKPDTFTEVVKKALQQLVTGSPKASFLATLRGPIRIYTSWKALKNDPEHWRMADQHALYVIFQQLKQACGHCATSVEIGNMPAITSARRFRGNLVVLGHPAVNAVARALIEEDLSRYYTGFRIRCSERELMIDIKGRETFEGLFHATSTDLVDTAFVVFGPNPYYPAAKLLLIVGGMGIGTAIASDVSDLSRHVTGADPFVAGWRITIGKPVVSHKLVLPPQILSEAVGGSASFERFWEAPENVRLVAPPPRHEGGRPVLVDDYVRALTEASCFCERRFGNQLLRDRGTPYFYGSSDHFADSGDSLVLLGTPSQNAATKALVEHLMLKSGKPLPALLVDSQQHPKSVGTPMRTREKRVLQLQEGGALFSTRNEEPTRPEAFVDYGIIIRHVDESPTIGGTQHRIIWSFQGIHSSGAHAAFRAVTNVEEPCFGKISSLTVNEPTAIAVVRATIERDFPVVIELERVYSLAGAILYPIEERGAKHRPSKRRARRN